MLVKLGSLTFYSGDHPDETGFTISGWQGWTDGPGQRRETTARRGGHGSFDAPSFAADRVFTFRGRYHGSSLADVERAGEALVGFEGKALPVTVERANTRWADARVDRVRFDEAVYAPRADYQVELWLPDPRKYGEVRTSTSTGAAVSASHEGNTDAWQRFTVTGGATTGMPDGYRLTGRGRVFDVPGPLAAGQSDEIDFATGLVFRNGALVLGVSPRAWSVPAGESVSWSLTPTGSGSGTAVSSVTDTFF